METPPGMTGRLFVAVEPDQERRAQYMAKETVKWFSQDKGNGGTKPTSGTSWTMPLGEAGTTETIARMLPLRKWGSLAPEGQGQCPRRVGRVARESLAGIANPRKTGTGACGPRLIASIALTLRISREPLAS